MISVPKLSDEFCSENFSSSDVLHICTKGTCKKLHVHRIIITQVKNIKQTVEEKINTGNIYDLNQGGDGLA